jgi:hypothetical protein
LGFSLCRLLLGFRVEGLGFRVEGLVSAGSSWGVGFRVWGLGFSLCRLLVGFRV